MQHQHAHAELAELTAYSAGLEPGVPVADRIHVAFRRRPTVVRGQHPAQRSRDSRADGPADRAPHGAPNHAAHPAADAPTHAAPDAPANPKAHAYAPAPAGRL